MYIKNIKLKDFRNYEYADISFSNGTNIIYGNNAQGKTNILEAIFLFCTARSHRRATDKDIIRRGANFGIIDIDFCDDVRDYKGKMKILDGKKKFVSINMVNIKKISQIADYINVVMFSPEDLAIIKDSPSLRRRFTDMAISQISPVYVSLLNEYLKILNQRNNLLKEIKRLSKDDDTLEVWDNYLVDLSCKIIKYRKEFIKNLLEYAKKIHYEISGEKLSIKYVSNCSDNIYDDDNLYNELSEKIKKNRKRDIETGTSNIGCHRDDFYFYINDQDVKIYGSQGQQRSVILSLKLALTEIIKNKRGAYPVILLDDIMSELDESRRKYLAGKIRDKQVIITCTDKEQSSLYSDVKYFHVSDGKITAQ